jgi:hypothetical protein
MDRLWAHGRAAHGNPKKLMLPGKLGRRVAIAPAFLKQRESMMGNVSVDVRVKSLRNRFFNRLVFLASLDSNASR